MKAEVFRVLDGGRIDKSKKHEYWFIRKTDTQNFQFSIDGDTEEEARKLALEKFVAKYRAMEPKKNWSKKVLDEPGLKSQQRIIELRTRNKMLEIANERKKEIKFTQYGLRVYFVVTKDAECFPFDSISEARAFALKIGKKFKEIDYVTV